MFLEYLFALLPYLLSVTVCVWVGWLAHTRKQDSASKALVGMAYSQALWIVAYLLQIITDRLELVLLWNNVQFLAAAALPVFYLGFALEYNYRQISFNRINWRYLFALTVALVLFIWLDGVHALFRTNPQVVREELFYRLVFVDGPLFNLYTIYAYTLIVIGTLFFIVKYIAAPRLFRLQIGIVLLGIIIPWLASIVTALRIIPLYLHDVIPVTFGISNLIIAWALFRYHLLDMVPIARDMLFENMTDVVIVVDPRNRIIDANPAAYRLLAAEPESLVARDITSLLPLASNWSDFGVDQSTKVTEMTIPGKGMTQHFQVKVNRLSLQGREVNGYVLTLHNITEQKQVEFDLRRSMALTQATLDSSGSGILVFDQALKVLLHNQRLAELFDLPANWQNNIDKRPLDMLAQKMFDANPFLSALENMIDSPFDPMNVMVDLNQGLTLDCLITSYRVEGKEFGWLLSFRDVTERNKAEAKLRELAITDSLTGVFNRRHFYYVAQTELERSHRYDREMAIILLDIDHFKWVNDCYGHLVGDQVLQALASRCRNNLRIFDSIGRFGGEEFIILLPETGIHEALQIAERLRHAIETISIATPKGRATITISLGVSFFVSGKPVSLDHLVDFADKALYQAKENGRNRVAVYRQQQATLPGIE